MTTSEPLSCPPGHIGELNIASSIQTLCDVLPNLLRAVHSDAVRNHKLWGRLIPYDVSVYGEGPSRGHCIRPDIVVTEDGIKISEFDFVPSGRGFALNALENDSFQGEFLEPFRLWYQAMDARRVLYGTASKTTCWAETNLFAERMRTLMGFDIDAVNLDECSNFDGLVDRLSYRSEMASESNERRLLREAPVITAEPYLDSKMIFALVHDPDMESALCEFMTAAELGMLREMIPYTRALESCTEGELDLVAGEHKTWVIKSTDVETDECWGSRGTVIGSRYTRSKFRRGLFQRGGIQGKRLGRYPVLQRFASSRDFVSMWNRIACGALPVADQSALGWKPQDVVATEKKVFARVGTYILIANTTGEVFTTPHALITLRQSPLVHGASDAVVTVAKMV